MIDKFENNYPNKKTELLNLLDCEWFWVVGEDRMLCNLCPNNQTCLRLRERITRSDVKAGKKQQFFINYNTSVRYEPNGEVEFLRYDKPWQLELKDELLENNFVEADRSKLLGQTDDGTYTPIKDSFTYQKLYRSMNNSRKRSLQKFYNYCMSNEWQYFLTLTFSSEHVNRYNDAEVIEKWSEFQRWLKRKNPEAKIIVVPEYHKKENAEGKKALHFHGFLADCPNIRLTPAKNDKGEYLYSYVDKSPILQLLDWEYGFSTVAVIRKDNNYLRCSNYMTKYMGKSTDRVGYGKKTFYHTRNLDMSPSINYLIPDNDFEKIKTEYNLTEVKTTKGMTVFRGRKEKDSQ